MSIPPVTTMSATYQMVFHVATNTPLAAATTDFFPQNFHLFSWQFLQVIVRILYPRVRRIYSGNNMWKYETRWV